MTPRVIISNTKNAFGLIEESVSGRKGDLRKERRLVKVVFIVDLCI
jgi:hypothetical protein